MTRGISVPSSERDLPPERKAEGAAELGSGWVRVGQASRLAPILTAVRSIIIILVFFIIILILFIIISVLFTRLVIFLQS